ncbi:MAG: beta strand repeat-containing protein [Gammaproteobacteria bacterium]
MITQSNKSSSVTAELGDASGDTANVSGFDSVSLNASDQGAVSASSTGGAGGLGIAADGADANATDSAAVTAQVGKNTQITTPTNGSVSIQASDTPDTSANVIGVAVAGGVGLAVSVATAQVMHTVTSTVLGGASITGPGSLSISASSSPDGGNDPTAYANSIAGGGGVLAGADGSVAIATSGGYDSGFNPVSGQSASIAASTGSGVALPDGDISITATNTTNQSSNATGVAVGFLAVGATVSQAGSNTSTTATLGSGDTGTLPTHTTPGRDGDITVQATGTDNNLAASTAGSGGAIAGNAAVAQTDDTPTVTALIGNNLDLTAGTITLAAQHTDNYAAEGNTVNAAIAGASGADAINNANANVTACIGLAVCTPNGPTTSTQDTDLIASGDISISADNYFNEVNSGDSAQGAGGGVLSGQAVSSSTTLNGGAAVNFGDNTSLDSGTDFVNNPGGINVSVESGLIADDTVTLTTGGAITVAGTNSSLDANLNNNVTLGQSDTFVSDGEIGLGTDTQVRASTNSEGHTWDLGGASVSYATTDVTSNQNIDVGSDDTLMGFGDVNITAGEANGYDTSISGLANAQSYITGLIVIPYASANTTLLSQANVNVASGANILSAGDITLGAYEGQPQGSADGTGHGYELGFIPATSHNSNVTTQNCGSQGCGTLTIDGTVIAGIYHELNININAAGQLQAPTTPEAPFLTANNPNFDAQAYVETLPGYADSSVLQLLASDVATNAPAFAFSTLYAAGGNVTLNADNITGSGGSVTAYGAPTITVNNYSPDYLVFGSLDVPSTPSGQVLFTGLADQSQATANGVSIATPGAGQLASITINDIWTGRSGNGSEGPAIFLSCSNLFGPCAQSDLENNGTNNLLGSVSITDENGSYGQFNNGIAAQSIVIDVPNGLVGITNPNGLVVTGESPLSAWQDEMLNMSDPNVAVAYVANWLFQGSRGSDQQLTAATVNQGCNAGMVLGCSTVVGDGNGNYGTSGGVSWDFYGSCIPAGPWDCSGGTADSDSPIGQSLGSDYYGHSSDFQYPMIPVEPLSTTTLNYPTDFPVGQTNSQLTGAEVAIQAKYIDVDSNITAGNATSWSTQISSAINTWITDPASNPDSLAAEQAAGDCSNGICPIPSTYLTNSLLSTLSPGDSQVTAGYDTSNNQIVLNNINASGGGFVYFNGGIISTNQSGSININDGYGHVTVDNQSGYSLVVNNVNTGNGAVGEVQIVDTLKPKNNGTPDTTWYVYSQGSGLSVYNNTQGETTLAQAVTDNDLLSGASSSYQPLQDAQLVWTETANMYRGVDWSTHTSTKWSFDYPNPHDPSNPWSVSSFNVTTDPSGEPPAFQETVTGASASDDGNWGYDFFHGCNSSGTDCHWSYPEVWETDFITSASITVQDAVKADNPIAISFQGNSSGAINISSNNSVTVGGQLYNPSGSTSISASNATAADGYIAQGSSGSVLSNNLTLNATGGIGGTPVTGTNGLVDSFQSPFKAQLIAGSAVNAAAGAEGIQLSFNSSALIGLVSSGNAVSGYGNVSISAEGDLNAGGSYSLLPVNQQSGSYLSGTLVIAGPGTIIGDDINLVSSTGGVGGDGTPLTLVNGYSLLPQSGGTQGTVNVSALNDINLVGVGDMLVDQIDSATGNVSVYVPNGRILDANALTASQTLSQEQLETIWDNLKLAPFTDPSTGISVSQTDINNAVTANTIAPFEYLVQSNYQNYWRLLDNGSVVNGQFQPSATGSTLFGPLAQANNETVQQYTSNQYQQIVTFFNNNLGSEWQDQSQFQSYVANWTYTATQAQVTALTSNSSYMNTGQLTQAINSTALLPSSGTLVGNAIPNISGRQVALVSGSGVGALGTPVTINVACSATVTDCLMNGTLNPTEAAALATAITPGDVTPVVQGTTITGLAVIQTEPLFVNPTGPLSVNGGQGAVYLQANQNLEVANVTAYGDVWLAANGDITNVAPSGQSAITTYDGGNLTLISGNGNLGTPAAGSASTVPLTLNLSGSLLAASAGQGIILEQLNGNLVVGHVYAVGDENISAPMGSILADPDVQGLNFLAQNITLTAQNNLGSVSQPLEIQDGGSTTGLFNGSSGGIVDVYSPANTSPANTNFAIGELSAGSDLNVTTGLGVNLSAITLTSGGVLTAASGNDANFGQVSSQQQLSLDSFGDMTLDSAVSQTGNISATSGGLFAVTTLAATNGSIIASSVGDMDLAAKGQFDTSNSQTLTAGSFTMNAGSQLQAGGPIAITTTINSITVTDSVTNQSSLVSSSGDITLGSVDSTLANGMALSLNATGAILGNDDGQTNLTAVAGAQTQLQAGTGIGQPQLPLVTMLPWLQANTLSGGIYIHDLETLNAPNGLNAGGDINLSVVGDLTFGNASAGGNAMLDATGKVSGATLESGTGNTVVTGGADITLTNLNSGESADVTSAGKLSITSATAGQDIALNSVNGIGFQQLTAGSNINGVTTQGDILGGSLDAGGAVNLSGVNIQLDDAKSGISLALAAQQALNAGVLTSGGAINLQAGSSVNLDSVSAGQGITFLSAGDFAFQQLTADGDINGQSSNGNILGGSLNANGDINLSGVNLILGHLTAGGSASLKAVELLNLPYASIGGNLSLTSAGSLDFEKYAVGSTFSAESTQGSITGESLTAVNADLSALKDIQLSSADITHSLNLAAADITANVYQSKDTSPFQMTITGFNGGIADNVALEVDASGGLTLVLLRGKQVQLNTTAEQVQVNQAYVPDWFYLVTPSAKVLVANADPVTSLRPVDVQLYQPNYSFQLIQSGQNTFTDSYVVQYQFPYQVQVPNYDQSHASMGPTYDDESVVRNVFRNLMNNPSPLDTSLFGIQAIVNPDGTVSYPGLAPQTVTASPQGAVNTGTGPVQADQKR